MKTLPRLIAKAFFLTIATSFSVAVNAGSAFPDFSALDSMIKRVKTGSGLPSGTAVILVQGTEVIYEGYYGYADVARKIPVDADTNFYIASSTKPFFALNLLMKSHEEKLDTKASLQSLFPDIRFDNICGEAVTVRDLLVHTSGVENSPLVWATAFTGLHDAESRKALVAASYANEAADPGTFDYSNVGYNILSVWADEAFDTPWQDQLQQEIFGPLGMSQTSAYMSAAAENGWEVARPYSLMSNDRQSPLYLEKEDATMHAAGGMISTAPDLATFLITQLNNGKVDGRQVLPNDVISKSQTKQVATDTSYRDFQRDGYAWGWYTGDYKERRMLHHFGGFAGFHAHLSFIPEADLGLVVLNNEDFLSSRLTSLIADLTYGIALDEHGVEEKVEGRGEKLLTKLDALDGMLARQREKIEGRDWQLTRPLEEYAGSYVNPQLGTVHVERTGDERLRLEWGRLHATATGFERDDVIRVEFVPGSGDLGSFIVNDGAVRAFRIDGMEFMKQ